MKKKNKKALVLNADFMPLAVTSWKSAITRAAKNKDNPKVGVQVVDFYKDDFIKGTHGSKYPIPAVVRSVQYIKPKSRRIPFNRKNIFIRDNLSCQYCGKKLPVYELTYDHVIPRVKWDNDKKGTPTKWTNIVTCCRPCNRKKGGRTPAEAKMDLKSKPQMPPAHRFVKGFIPWEPFPDEWKIYLSSIYKGLV